MDKNQRKFLLFLVLYNLGNTASITFTNLFLWQSTSNISLLLFYNATVFFSMAMGGCIAGFLAKWRGTRFTYQTSMALYACQLLLLVILGNRTQHLVVIVGIISGLAIGVQSFAFNVTMQKLTTQTNREQFLGIKTSLLNVVSLISVPLIAFFIQRFNSYLPFFSIAFVIFLCLIYVLRTLDVHDHTDVFTFENLGTLIYPNEDLKRFFKAKLLYGMQDGLFWTVLGVITLNFLGSLSHWGIFSGGLTLLTIVTAYIYGKKITLANSNYTAVGASILFAMTTIVFAANWNLFAFIAYQVVLVLLLVSMSVDFDSFLSDILDHDPKIAQLRNEYNAIGEVVTNAGRLIPVIVLLSLHVSVLDDIPLRIVFLAVAPLPLFIMKIMSETTLLQLARLEES